MRHVEVKDDLWPLICNFFFWFSRFESALKENNWLKSDTIGATALADWKSFVEAYAGDYAPSDAAERLIAANPQKQIVTEGGLTFTDVTFKDSDSQLDRVALLLKTVRNNLFHGGKHGSAYWDDAERIRLLLPLCITVLDELAERGEMQADYTGYY
ncbi:hypothetical protein FHX06_003393 [Rhizobium sp. BK512]|uniref:hypothetical protein n=1 Tax=Rhizobium sp. BK512 TaxID=2587010 RepID=UPI00160E5566|nr:hypothetical protein [Rhizobium sp. BK512]MBB3562062.1 hypothetical protein [Rhizobium sp. BK512]